jgi:ABC-2 type transport system permease protein
MTWTLWRKLLRDVRLTLVGVALLLGLFQVLWAKVTERVLSKLAPFFNALAGLGGLTPQDIEAVVFEGPGKVMRTIMGGDRVQLDTAMDLLSIGYVHPMMQLIFCIWAISRAAGAIAGELDRGTMELLLAQPLARSRLWLAHLLLDLVTIPLLCLCLWLGNWAGAWLITPIRVEDPKLPIALPRQTYLVEFGPFRVRVEDPAGRNRLQSPTEQNQARMEARLRVEPWKFLPGLIAVGGLIFAICGLTLWLSSCSRYRWRVLALAITGVLLMFLANLLGQMWDDVAWLRPLSIFYYYQPQQMILSNDWCVSLPEWNGGQPLVRVPMPVVLYGVGALGYVLALWTLQRRDLPAPL